MKKTAYLFVLLIITGTVFISSCEKDPVVVLPSINFVTGADYVSADVTLSTNNQFKVGINANKDTESDNKLTNFKVVRTFNNIPTTVLDSTINGDYFSIEILENSNPLAGDERWTYTITDEAGESSEVSMIITTDPPPSISFVTGVDYVSTDVTLLTNNQFKVGINATKDTESDNKLTNFKVVRTFNNIPFIALDSTINGDYFSIEIIANSHPLVGEERWTYTITDEAGVSSEINIVITTEAGIQEFANVTLGSYNDDVYGSFFNTTSGETFFKAEATTNQEVIDFIFFLGTTNGATIAAPDNQDVITVFALDWATQNQTRFMTTGISVPEFDAIGASYNFTDFTGTDDSWNQLVADDIVYFKTAGNKLGFFKVNSINAKGDIINIDVKVQK